MRIYTNEQWAAQAVAGFPVRWKKRLLSAHARRAAASGASVSRSSVTYKQYGVERVKERQWLSGAQIVDGVSANEALREITERLAAVRLPLDATDGDICKRAAEFAVQALDVGRIQSPEKVRAGMESFVRSCQVVPPAETVEDQPAILRMACADWWRRGLRKMHAKAVEGAAIQLGYVNKARDIYVSDESLARRVQQVRRNAAVLEGVTMRNELEQEFTLAELASKGTANKAIRRGELMTRIAGFEVIARECGHAGLFLTVTCPSRMHKWSSVSAARVVENAKYDGTTPREAQQYLSKCWARVRAKLARHGVKLYGFRIAEPHHDGCPHWHVLLFCEGWQKRRVLRVVKRYWLADSPGEAGAAQHRVTCVLIDWSRGSAAGYIAKYVAKNIDGLHVENDLYGNPALETSLRVEAWASTWGIRQFQQVGGAPVGVWRELRRVKALPEDAPEHLRVAHEAVNRVQVEGGEVRAANWASYTRAQGGVFVGRDTLIKIATEEVDELGRYGEAMAEKPVGVLAAGLAVVVRSVRHIWEVVKRAGRSLAPRTGVNNCTRSEPHGLENVMIDLSGWIEKIAPPFGGGGGMCGAT